MFSRFPNLLKSLARVDLVLVYKVYKEQIHKGIEVLSPYDTLRRTGVVIMKTFLQNTDT